MSKFMVVPTRILLRFADIIIQFAFVVAFVYWISVFLDPILFPNIPPTTIQSTLFGASIGIWVSPSFRDNIKHIWRWMFYWERSKLNKSCDMTEKRQNSEIKGNILDDNER